MRIYQNFKEALSEIKRDLVEMGVRTHPRTYQDKVVEDDPGFDTMEINNYIYTVTNPKFKDLNPTQPWADEELLERVSGNSVNPGEAYKKRPKVWEQFLEEDGRFSYTYSERLDFHHQVEHIADRIRIDRDSRQLYIAIWNPKDVTFIGKGVRDPCSLGYYFKMVQGKLDMTYLQRSADFVTHLENDIFLSYYIQSYIATAAEVLIGNYCHWIGSLHIFKKDGKGVF